MLKKFLPFVLIVSVILTACSVDGKGMIMEGASVAPETGQVYAIQLRSTLWGMQQAARGAAGTTLFQKDTLITFAWRLRDGWGFAVIDTSAKDSVKNFAELAGKGNFVNAKSMRDLAKVLLENGWKIIPAAKLPTSVTAALGGGSSWLTALSAKMTSFFVVPAGAFITPEILSQYGAVKGSDL